jgi:hypothetical protein
MKRRCRFAAEQLVRLPAMLQGDSGQNSVDFGLALTLLAMAAVAALSALGADATVRFQLR